MYRVEKRNKKSLKATWVEKRNKKSLKATICKPHEYRQLAISGSLSKRLELIKWQLASDG